MVVERNGLGRPSWPPRAATEGAPYPEPHCSASSRAEGSGEHRSNPPVKELQQSPRRDDPSSDRSSAFTSKNLESLSLQKTLGTAIAAYPSAAHDRDDRIATCHVTPVREAQNGVQIARNPQIGIETTHFTEITDVME